MSFGPCTRFLKQCVKKMGSNYSTSVSKVELLKNKRPYTVVVEGNIGSGKTTFLTPFEGKSCGKMPIEVMAEPVNMWRNLQGHNLLQLMYQDPARWAMLFQTYVQLTMVQMHTKPTTAPVRIMERSLARYCFVENLHQSGKLVDSEYLVLSEWFNFLVTCPQLDFKVDQIIYLRTDPEVAHERIKKRARAEEHLIPLQYLKDLHELHEDWLVRGTKFTPPAPVTIIDANGDLDKLSSTYEKCEKKILENAASALSQ